MAFDRSVDVLDFAVRTIDPEAATSAVKALDGTESRRMFLEEGAHRIVGRDVGR